MRSVIGLGLVAVVSVLVMAVGCGDSDSAVETLASEGQATPSPGSIESRWIESSRIQAAVAAMRRDIRSFIRDGRPAESLVYGDETGWRYFCGRKLGRGGPPPTKRLAEARRLAREACDHLQRALEASLTFNATTQVGDAHGGDREGAARAAREAKPPLTRAMALLEAARRR